MSDKRFEYWVPGPPAAKGSMSAYPMRIPGSDKYRCVMTHDSADVRKWQDQIMLASKHRYPRADVCIGPIKVALQFAVPRPRSHITKDGARLRKNAPAHPTLHSTKDVDKLARCILDALTGVFFKDDSQVIDLYASKAYASTVQLPTECTQPGVKITVVLL